MVSLRRRKLLGLCSGVRNTFLVPFPNLFNNGIASESDVNSTYPLSVNPLTSEDNDEPPRRIGSTQLKDRNNQPNTFGSTFLTALDNESTAEQEVKRRKQHRTRRMHRQEQSVLRGVYLKNMKWQAAIKVDKKQIHLGTVSSPEEAAHLYDRAAFMCGREPNFELPEWEKDELRKFKWDEFLAITRRAISCKKTRRQHGRGTTMNSAPIVAWEGETGAECLSASDDAEQPDFS